MAKYLFAAAFTLTLATLVYGTHQSPAPQQLSARQRIEELPAFMRADAKAEEILKHEHRGIYTANGTDIEITAVEEAADGVQVFVKARRDGKDIGFGKDGDIETERIRIVNPPLLVPDGTCTDTQFERPDGSFNTICFPNYREDPQEALRRAVADTVKHIGKEGRVVRKGTVGNTTTTIYGSTEDVAIRKSNGNFTTARGSATGDSVQNTTASYASVGLEGGSTYNFYIVFHTFDTSSIPSTDEISSATYSFSLVGDNNGTAANQWAVTQGHQTTWNGMAVGDFDQRRDSLNGGTEGATRQNRKVSTETGYQDFALNATGISWIARSGETKPATASGSGITQLVMAWAKDIDNSAPATNDYNQVYMADQTGTTNDPKLVVEHAAAPTPIASEPIFID